MEISGKVKLDTNELKPAMIKIGFGEVGIFDQMRERSVWKVEGDIRFKGKANIGHGCKICVGKEGKLFFGENIIITAESSIICNKEINIDDEAMISWETQIMDTDLHDIFDESGNIINKDDKIEIGKKVWIGCRCLILKGVKLEAGSIIAAGTTVSKAIEKEGQGRTQCLFAGSPPRVIKENVSWF